ncbi:MAG: YsnF/AvaK domain-containing protein, partial [Ktedonobacterales bacterium]
PVHEEELIAGKRSGEVGRVRIHKEVVEEPRTINTTVRREQVRVENVPADQVSADASTLSENAMQGRDIEVPVMGEEVVVGKQTNVTGAVRVSKQAIEEPRQYSDTVRKEHVDVEGVDENGNPLNLGDANADPNQRMNP